MARDLFLAGLLAVKGYVATHVLTRLVPAFLLAGAMVTFVDRELVLQYLGRKAGRIRSYSLAAGSSFLIAACFCTVIPVAGGLHYAGAGISAAFILLWVAPSANILSLVYTGNVLGAGMVASRVVASLAMAFLVGIAMDLAFGMGAPEAEDRPEKGGGEPRGSGEGTRADPADSPLPSSSQLPDREPAVPVQGLGMARLHRGHGGIRLVEDSAGEDPGLGEGDVVVRPRSERSPTSPP